MECRERRKPGRNGAGPRTGSSSGTESGTGTPHKRLPTPLCIPLPLVLPLLFQGLDLALGGFLGLPVGPPQLVDDEQQEDDTEGHDDFGGVPEEPGVPRTPPPTLLMDDGNPHARASSPGWGQDRGRAAGAGAAR